MCLFGLGGFRRVVVVWVRFEEGEFMRFLGESLLKHSLCEKLHVG